MADCWGVHHRLGRGRRDDLVAAPLQLQRVQLPEVGVGARPREFGHRDAAFFVGLQIVGPDTL